MTKTVAGGAPPRPKRQSTVERSKTFADNLAFELETSGFGEDELLDKLNAKGVAIKETTLAAWLNGETANPPKEALKGLSAIFGFANPESIRRSNHIEVRKITKSFRQQQVMPSTIQGVGVIDLLDPPTEPTLEAVQAVLAAPFGEVISSLARLRRQ